MTEPPEESTMNVNAVTPDVVALARASSRTIMEVLTADALVASAGTWLPQTTRMTVGPVRPLSYAEAMDTRLGWRRVKGSGLRIRADYRTMRIDIDEPDPFVVDITRAGRVEWGTMLADGCAQALWVFPIKPAAYVLRGQTVDFDRVRIFDWV